MRIFGDRGEQADQLHLSAFEAGTPELAWIGESNLIEHTLDQAARFQNNLEQIVDTVEKKQGTLKITSVMSPTTLISYAIGDKTYRRESVSEWDKNGFRPNLYSEKRGDSVRTTSSFDYKKMNIEFFAGKKLERTEKINGEIADMLSVVYENLSNIKKSKSLFINNSKTNKPISFDEAELWDFTVNGKKYKAKRYSKKVNKVDAATFDIWLDEETKIPLRYQIGLNDNYGVTMLFELDSVKKLSD
jgi:hypothetical protein